MTVGLEGDDAKEHRSADEDGREREHDGEVLRRVPVVKTTEKNELASENESTNEQTQFSENSLE